MTKMAMMDSMPPPMGQKCESGKDCEVRRGAEQGLGRPPFPLVLCLVEA